MVAAGADRDVGDVRPELPAQLSALRETQLEQGQWIGKLGREMRAGFATLSTCGVPEVGHPC